LNIKLSLYHPLIMNDSAHFPCAPSSGLTPLVRQQLTAILTTLVPQWQLEPAADWKRVPRPTGPSSFAINIEPYQGVQSWISFRNKISATDQLASLEALIREQQPELLGHVSHDVGSCAIQDCFALCSSLTREACRRIGPSFSPDLAIASVISDLDDILTSGTAKREVLTALNGLKLPNGVDRIDLDKGLYIRALSADEIADIGSNDISSESRYDLTSKSVSTALISEGHISISLSTSHEGFTPDPMVHQLYQEQASAVLGALHLLKKGRVGVLATFTKVRPAILPNMSGYSSAPLVTTPFTSMELVEGDVETLIHLYAALIKTPRNEVSIAAARLFDAESRMSPVDGLLDAVIGLELLLNPNDRSELSFRVALNYAYLGPPSERRSRYEDVRDVQLTRNRVVHGGLNVRSKDAPRLYEHADLAKHCLRDAVVRFLTDESLRGMQKLDADFWLDRIIPPHTR
jgi:hypothetical protein